MKNFIANITLDLAMTRQVVRWVPQHIAADHELHAPVDGRSKPPIYLALH